MLLSFQDVFYLSFMSFTGYLKIAQQIDKPILSEFAEKIGLNLSYVPKFQPQNVL